MGNILQHMYCLMSKLWRRLVGTLSLQRNQDILLYLFITAMYVHLMWQIFIHATPNSYRKVIECFEQIVNSYVVIALQLLLVALSYLISHMPSWKPSKVKKLLTVEEIDQRCDNWISEPLVPTLTDYTQDTSPVLESAAGIHTVINGKSVVNFASANYLGLIGHEKLLDSCTSAVKKYGVGSCGPRGFYGTMDVHLECEAKISKFLGTSDSIVYSYGLATIFSPVEFYGKISDIIVADEGVHWGIQNGLQLLAGKKVIVYFKHNDTTSLENILMKTMCQQKRAKKIFIVIEAVYQNSGQIAPLDEIIRIKEKYGCIIMMDESNSFGVLGHSGRGLTEYYGIAMGKIDVITVTMGHSLASEGGFCTGSFCEKTGNVNHHRLNDKGYIFSASLPPYLASAAMSALGVLEEQPNLIRKLNKNISFLRTGLSGIQGLEVVSSRNSPIVFLKLTQSTGATKTDFHLLQDIANQLLKEHDVFVMVSKRSTIDTCPLPIGIRLFVSAGHSECDLTKLCYSLKTVCVNFLRNSSVEK